MEVGIITIVLEACFFFLSLTFNFICENGSKVGFYLVSVPLQTFYQVLVLELLDEAVFSTYNHVFIRTQSTSKQ